MPTIVVNDINMYYEVHGEGESLVLIGGLSNDVSDYARMIPELAQRYRVIAFDNCGAGRTDKPDAPYSIDMMASDAASLLSALGVEHAHILGVSMGGRIAIALTLAHPELVKSLILVSTFARRIPLTRRGIFRLDNPLMRLLRAMGNTYPQPHYAFLRQLQASRNYDATDRLGEIRAPTLILHGRNDHLAPFALAEEMRAGISGSQLIAFDGGHIFLFLQQKQFLAAVIAFLASQSKT